MEQDERKEHEFFMHRCIELAKLARERGDGPVGSLLLKNKVVVGEGIEGGRTYNDITCHAEIEAIRAAVKHLNTRDLSGCTLYTTHEPCIMCSYVIRHHKVNVVVTAVDTGDIGGYSSALPLLLDATISKWGPPPLLIKGVLREECSKLLMTAES